LLLRKDRMSMTTWASLDSEAATMQSLRRPHVLELVGVHTTEPYRIVTRFCAGQSLFDRLQRSPSAPLNARQLTAIAYEVADGMRFPHANGIVPVA
jgi:serine/threonine protein kinase